MSDSLVLFDYTGEYIKFNKSFLEKGIFDIFKKQREEKYISKLFSLDGYILDENDMPIPRICRGLKIEDEVIVLKEEEKRFLSVSGQPVYNEKGEFLFGIIMCKDITSYILYERAIKRQAEMLYQIIYNLDLPLIRLSYPNLTVMDINQKAYKIAKSKRPEIKSINSIVNESIEKLMPSLKDNNGNKEKECLLAAVKEKRTTYFKNKKQIINGSEVYSNYIFEPIFALNGEIQEIIIIMVDVTNEVKASEGIEKALRLQEEFFANISHELKTPLNVIYSAIQLFRMYGREGSLDDKKDYINKYIDTIIQNCCRLSKLINNIVDLSKIEAGFYELNKENKNIVESVENTVMSVIEYSEARGIKIVFDTDVEEKVIAFDPEKIERVMLNLISNAIKFSDAGDEINVYICDKNNVIEISVKDKGVGIDKKNISQIFERYRQADKTFSRNAEGTGIGLSIVKALVELHGGNVTVESELGKGSRFIVKLPAERIEEKDISPNNNIMLNSKHMVRIELSDI